MKKFLLTVAAVAGALFVNAQSVPNGSFETWNVVAGDTVIDGWGGTGIRVYTSIGINTSQGTVTRTADDATHFLMVRHQQSDTNPSTYLLGNLSSGFPFTDRPKSFTFGAMYFPQITGEALAIIITTKKSNGDTVSYSFGTRTASTNPDWTDLSMNLNYRTAVTGNPDSCFINFILLPTGTGTISPNTVLLVDNLRFNSFGVSVEETLDKNIGSVNVYPNPASSSTTFKVALNSASDVKVTLFDISGKEIQTVNRFMEAGVNTVDFNVSELNTGMYFYKVESSNQVLTGKLTVVK